jgi:hypothetical protein
MLSPNSVPKLTRKRLGVKGKSACSQKPVVQIPTSAFLQMSWNEFRKSVLTILLYTPLSKTTKTIKPEDQRYLTSPYIGTSGIALPRDHRVSTVLDCTISPEKRAGGTCAVKKSKRVGLLEVPRSRAFMG